MTKRIVITGVGVLSPIGNGKEAFWDQLTSGAIGTSEVKAFDASIFNANISGEIKEFNPERYFKHIDYKSVGKTTQLAVAASRMAHDDADLGKSNYSSEDVGVCIGTTMGNTGILEEGTNIYLDDESPGSYSKQLISHFPYSYISGTVSEELECSGPSITIPTACAAGNYAIATGKDLIEEGEIDVAIVGGTDGLSRACYTLFDRLGAIAPEKCQPFDKNRKGMIVSEGSAVLVLENMDTAIKRGASIYAELLGCGLSCDAHHATAPHPEGIGAILAMEKALKESGLTPKDISYISAHGTGTKANDKIESTAIRNLYGALTNQIPVSSIKSMIGHTMGAASSLEAVTCALSIEHNMVPPTMNFEELDTDCVKNVVPNQSLYQNVDAVLSNSFAFGGNISTIVMGAMNNDSK